MVFRNGHFLGAMVPYSTPLNYEPHLREFQLKKLDLERSQNPFCCIVNYFHFWLKIVRYFDLIGYFVLKLNIFIYIIEN
jgi:hypothetical protein